MPIALHGGNELLDPNFLMQKAGVIAGMQVADLGCGALGQFVFPAAAFVGKEGTVYAVDIQKSVLSGIEGQARIQGFSNVATVWSNLEQVGATKILEGSLDRDFLINTLFQTKDRAAVIKEAVRLLKSGGRLLVVEWKKAASPVGPPITMRIDAGEVEQIAGKEAVTRVDAFEAGKYHWGLIFEKRTA